MNKIFCVIPSHNRIQSLNKCITCVCKQSVNNCQLKTYDAGHCRR